MSSFLNLFFFNLIKSFRTVWLERAFLTKNAKYQIKEHFKN